MSTIHVCAEKDIMCGDRPEGWCQGCPKLRTHDSKATGPAWMAYPKEWNRPTGVVFSKPPTPWLDTAVDWDFHGKPITRRDCILQQCGALALAYVEAAIEHYRANGGQEA